MDYCSPNQVGETVNMGPSAQLMQKRELDAPPSQKPATVFPAIPNPWNSNINIWNRSPKSQLLFSEHQTNWSMDQDSQDHSKLPELKLGWKTLDFPFFYFFFCFLFFKYMLIWMCKAFFFFHFYHRNWL